MSAAAYSQSKDQVYRIGAFRAPQALVHIAVLAALTVLVYANTIDNTFFLDDHYYILDNVHIRSVQPIGRHLTDPATMSSIRSNVVYRPLLPISLSLTYALHGYDVVGYHAFNITFQALAAIFVYLLLSQLLMIARARTPAPSSAGPPREIALFAATIFAVHPISGFVVNYSSSRDNLMMLTFLLAALVLYVRLRRLQGSRLIWIPLLALLALSLLAKPNAILAPFLVLAIELVVFGTSLRSKRLWARLAPFALVAAVFFVVRSQVLAQVDQPLFGAKSGTDLGAHLTYLMTQLKYHLFHYLRNFTWPFHVRALPSTSSGMASDPRVWIGAAAIAASLVAAWLIRRRSPVVSFAILGYWLMFSLTSSVLLTHGIVAERWMYPSMPFVSLVVAYLIYQALPGRGARLLAALVVVYFGVSSVYMNGHYRDACSVWSQSARHGTTATGYVNLGRCYMERGDDRSKQYFEKALEVFPNAYIAEINLGVWYLDHGQPDKGLEYSRLAVQHAPPANRGLAHHWLAKALVRAGRPQLAFDEARNAALLNPRNVQYLYGAAFQGQLIGEFEPALTFLDKIHESQSHYELSRFIAGWCLQSLGRLDEAVTQYELAIEHTPRYTQTYLNLGYAHQQLGDCPAAIRAFERYLELQPGNTEAKEQIRACRKHSAG
jgi:tetratricopeptide (TPR) repeat protein